MTPMLRGVLIAVSILNCCWTLWCIRKAQVKIADSVFWLLFSGVLIVVSVFPGVVDMGARLTGVQAPVNFVFLTIIFILLLKIFRMSVRLSQTESKLQDLAQQYALDHVEQARETSEADQKERDL